MTSKVSSLSNGDSAGRIGSLSRSLEFGHLRSLIFCCYTEQSLDLCSEFVRISAGNPPKTVWRCCELVESAALGHQRCRERSVEIW
jgi:hypothetical protein